MKTQLEMVEQFHRAFAIPLRNEPLGQLPAAEYTLRHQLLEEENREYLEACEAGDLVQIADALGDLLYVLMGTMVTHGLQHKMEAVFAEIHASNLSKLDAAGKPIHREDGKVMKSDRFFRPRLAPILNKNSELQG